MSSNDFVSCIREAERAVFDYCSARNIPLYRIEHVASWAEWDRGVGVYFFLERNSHLRGLGRDQLDFMKRAFLDTLEKTGFPMDRFPEIIFYLDSHENVVRKFQGNYFLRLR